MWWLWIVLAIYLLGFIGTYFVNMNAFPVTQGLAVYRALVWPVWLGTGMRWPSGAPEPMD